MEAPPRAAGAFAHNPVLLLGLKRRTEGALPDASQLQLQLGPKEVSLVEARRGGRVVAARRSTGLGRRGLPAALAALVAGGAVACSLRGAELQQADNEEEEESEVVALLEVTPLPPLFDVEEGDALAPHVAALVEHWRVLEQALAEGAEAEEEEQDGSDVPFAQDLRAGWWPGNAAQQQQQQQQHGSPAAAEQSPGGGGGDDAQSPAALAAAAAAAASEQQQGEGGNLRDRIFALVLPHDWHAEDGEPEGLACTLFRFQRRCLAWMKWRESLVGSSGDGGSGAKAPWSPGSPLSQPALPDAGSAKAALPADNLQWQPLALPSGLRVHCDPLHGCLRREPVTPPLPEVPGGLLCDEMGLGKTVEMLALFMANPPPYPLARQQLPGASSQGDGQHAGDGSDVEAEEAAGEAAAAGAGAGERSPGSKKRRRPGLPAAKGTSNGGGRGGRASVKEGDSIEEAAGDSPRGGTLIVCPPALLQQWQAELANHAHGALSVEIYEGLRGQQGGLGAPSAAEKRLKPGQREAELYLRLLAGEEIEASFDAEAETAAALRRIAAADVVLTSFDVLRAEVHFTGDSGRAFRRPKKYAVPLCPLLQLRWWRLVIDEAQMVGGGLSAAGVMCERLEAVHRWCVTGTPIGSHRNELSDIYALLRTLQHQPFADERTWRALVAEPIARGGPAARAAWGLLATVLRPIMWRNNKAVVAQEFHLPHRSLRPTWLHFQPGERAFYEQVVERTRAAREELLSFRRQQERGSDEDEDADDEDFTAKPQSPAALRTRRRRAEKLSEKLASAAADNLTQLRLACVHPQLTKAWKDMAAEGQIGVGATLSMEEIMQRLVDGAQNDLQESERSLCATLNTMAMRLLDKAEAPPAKGGGSQSRAADVAADSDEEGGAGPASPRPAKRARKSRGGFDALAPAALRQQAQQLLEQSFKVAEKGIAAIDVPMEELNAMPDITAAFTSTVNAWKRLQINTAAQLSKLHAAAGRQGEAAKMDADAQEKMAYLREQAQMELTQAKQRLEQVAAAAHAARQAFRQHLSDATQRGFSGWGVTGNADRWLAALERSYEEAQELEEQELAAQEGLVKAMLGVRVSAALDDVEKQLHGELTQLDRFVGEQHTAAAYRRLAREQHGWDAAAAGGGAAGSSHVDSSSAGGGSAAGSAEAAVVERGVALLWDILKLLPDFRRKTLQAQHVSLFARQLAAEGERKSAEAAKRRAEAAAQRAAAGGGEAEVVEVAEEGDAVGAGAQQEQQEQQEQGQEATRQQSPAPAQQQQQQQEGGAAAGPELAGVLGAVEAHHEFTAAGRWLGRIKGYVFKTGSSGLGYYRDEPPKGEASLGQLHHVATAVSRALQEHQRRLARAAGPEAARFGALSLDAVEAKLESVKQQIQLVRALRERHTAERTTALKQALAEDLDTELAAAARLPPLPTGGSADKLSREAERLKERAQGLLHRRRYMEARVSEARQLQPGSGVAAAGQPAEGQEQRQQQQQQQQQQQAMQVEQRQEEPPDRQAAGSNGFTAAAAGIGPPAAAAATGTSTDTAAAEPGTAAAGPSAEAGPSAAYAELAGGMECPVCLTVVPAGGDINVFSGCGHAFCSACTGKLVLLQGVCAVCRAKVTKTQVFRVAAGGARPSGTCDPEFEAFGKIQPQGEWSAKVEALLRRLLHLQTTAPAEKALVFSQFPEALKLVALALQTNGIRFVQLIGGRKAARRAVAAFRDDEEVRVFLLSHRAGAAGLTLVRANHVFLLEPALEPAIEQQAVARVHRMGQLRPVTVSRLLVRDSIEASVLALQESKHALFAGADGGAEDTAELATTVEAPVRPETLGEEDMRGLLEGV